jgi:hypothetical protein
MRERLEALQRMTAAVHARKRAFDMHVMVISQRIEALAAAERTTTEAISEPLASHAAMTQHYLKRVDGLRRQKERLARELQSLKLQGLEAKRDVKRCELLEERERHAIKNKRDTRALQDVIDISLLRRS